ncbi:tetratricopeptide repeat protein [Brevibacterium spongiae]|uniref:Tetratricopeptide repeat protein n=1 Tax=Brevibacterium spongiae TaxID=2909672 RepID=A0ABY5SPR2_9MICO|nr:tetratricopeptide repeat protein [Brevibacterium spongiae]UVI35064.1 tetratricopeptide repeat protein [Brevibacterium spongiae]
MNRLTSLWARLARMTKINLILGTVFALLFGYIAMATYFGTASQVRYTSNDFPGAKKAATAFLRVSPFQRHIGYYNRGTSEAAVGDYDAAQTDLEAALEIAPTSAECAVRINLSFVYEKQADQIAAQDHDQSQELYDRSLKTLEDAPEECQPKKSEEKQKSGQAKERVEDKKKGEQAKEEGSGDDSQDQDSKDSDGKDEDSKDKSDDGSSSEGDDEKQGEKEPDDSSGKSEREKKREELEKRGEDSDRQQQQQGPGGNGGRSSPDKPW